MQLGGGIDSIRLTKYNYRFRIGPMKKVAVIFVMVMAGLVLAGGAWASEGMFKLNSVNGSGVGCLALSVFTDNRYEVLGTCRGLKVPFSAEETYYIVWRGDDQGNWNRLTEVDHGKFSVNSADKFSLLQVTAETDWAPRKPSGSIVAEGKVGDLPFGGGSEIKTVEKIEVTPSPTTSKTKVETKSTGETTQKGSLFGAILKVIGTGLLILVGGAVVMTVITRRKGF